MRLNVIQLTVTQVLASSAADLRNPDSVGVAERGELRDWKVRPSTKRSAVLVYAALAMIPITILVLLLIVAHTQ